MGRKENLKVMSVRLDPETIEKIDAFVRKYFYWKRNTVINAVLWAALHDFDDEAVYEMVRRNRYRPENVEAKYRINRLNVKPTTTKKEPLEDEHN